MVRSPLKAEVDHGLKKGPWTQEEDEKLKGYIEKHGHGSWQSLPRRAGLNRCGKSCRLRWTNYLRPDIKRGNFSPQEIQTIIDLHATLGNKWAMIATRLPGRTDNEIKNYWNTNLRKKLLRAGIDPTTHQLLTNFTNFPTTSVENLANIRFLQNLLGFLSSNPLPSFMVGSDVRNMFDANGIPHPNLHLQSRVLENDRLSSDYEPVSNTFRPPEIHQDNKNSISSSEYFLPGLTTAAPGISSGNISHGGSVHDCSSAPPFQNLDELFSVDDEIYGSLWKDTFYDSLPSFSL